MSYTFHQENEAWTEDKPKPVDDGGETVVDPTAMSGTLDTSGTTGTTETAADVSDVFDVADQATAESKGTEESLGLSSEDDLAKAGETADEKVDEEVDETEPSVGDENKFDGRKDPGDYTVKEVQAYLATATEKQKASVRAKEAKGQNRVGIMND